MNQARTDLLEAEYRLKGSGLPEYLVLEDFLFSVLQTQSHARQDVVAR